MLYLHCEEIIKQYILQNIFPWLSKSKTKQKWKKQGRRESAGGKALALQLASEDPYRDLNFQP